LITGSNLKVLKDNVLGNRIGNIQKLGACGQKSTY